MNKNNKTQSKYDPARALVYKTLATKHEVSVDFVRKAVHGERDSETAALIKKEFAQLTQSVKTALS